LYQLWWRQALLDERLIVRIGKSIPTFDFNNVSSRLNIPNEEPYVANVSGLLFTPIFVNPSVLLNPKQHYEVHGRKTVDL